MNGLRPRLAGGVFACALVGLGFGAWAASAAVEDRLLEEAVEADLADFDDALLPEVVFGVDASIGGGVVGSFLVDGPFVGLEAAQQPAGSAVDLWSESGPSPGTDLIDLAAGTLDPDALARFVALIEALDSGEPLDAGEEIEFELLLSEVAAAARRQTGPDSPEFSIEVELADLLDAEIETIQAFATALAEEGLLEVAWTGADLAPPGTPGGGLVFTASESVLSVGPDGDTVVEVVSPLLATGETEGADWEAPEAFELLTGEGVGGLLFADDFLAIGSALLEETALPVDIEADSFVLVDRSGDGLGPVAVSATSLEAVAATVDTVRVVLWSTALGMSVVLAGVVWFMTGRALKPVEHIRRQVDEISGGNLDARVPEPGTGDEVDGLARTMNRMLGRIEASDARRRRFVSDASHELRSPVASIAAEIEVAQSYPDSAEWPEVATNVRTETDRLAGIIDGLLVLARADEADDQLQPGVDTAAPAERDRSSTLGGGGPGPLPARGDLAEVDLDEVVLAEARRRRSLDVDRSRVSGGRVVGRSNELTLVARHLLDNAVRHADTMVSVALVSHEGRVTLTVDDDGGGVPAADRDVVFERFTRLDEARARDEGGAGLGLAVVAAIVARHGGEVSVSDSDLGGARFTVDLPGV